MSTAFPGWMPVTVYAIIVLVFVGFYAWGHLDNRMGRRPFTALVFLVAFQLLNDFISRFYVFTYIPEWIIVATTYINFAVLPGIGLAWYLYVRGTIVESDQQNARKTDIVVYILMSLGLLIIAVNPFTGLVFYYDDLGNYFRGSMYFVPAGSAFLCILIAEVYLLTRIRFIGRRSLITLLFFPVPPIVGAIAATITYGLPWMPLGLSISMVVLFASTFTSTLNTDYLTSVVNRRRIEELLEERIDSARAGKPFAAIMVDVDDFKQINDTLGHATGDAALGETARLLKESLRGIDVVGRYGGDEFFALLDVANQQELEAVVERIVQTEAAYNSEQTRPYGLRLSKGYAMFDPAVFATGQEFEAHLDKLMYAEKQAHKAARTTPVASQ